MTRKKEIKILVSFSEVVTDSFWSLKFGIYLDIGI